MKTHTQMIRTPLSGVFRETGLNQGRFFKSSCCIHPVSITRLPSFRTQTLENLSVDSVKNGFLSNPDPGENLVSGNLVMETGCIVPGTNAGYELTHDYMYLDMGFETLTRFLFANLSYENWPYRHFYQRSLGALTGVL